jgi:NifB/MoaA-like Fe-S oxidoreductase
LVIARRTASGEPGRTKIALPRARPAVARATLVTGQLFGPTLAQTAAQLQARTGVRLEVVPVVNDFLGETVTAAGLIAGRDVLRQLVGRRIGELLLVPRRALDQREELFLDGVGVAEVARTLGAPVVAGGEFADLVRALGVRP